MLDEKPWQRLLQDSLAILALSPDEQWQYLRESAAEALLAFGWGRIEVQACAEVQRGLWHRPLADAGSAAAPD